MTAPPNPIQQQNADLFRYLIDTLGKEFGAHLLGILATGSRIHGTPAPNSDLDAHVVIDLHQRQRRNLVVDGVELELFINPPFQIRRYFADERGVDPHMFTFGTAIHDPHGVIAELQAEARAIWEQGPPAIDEHMRWLPRYAIADLLRDLDDVATSDEATATMLIVHTIEELIETHTRLHGRWAAKPKRRLSELERWDSRAAQMVRACIGHGTLDQRIVTLRQFADYVLEPIGGVMPLVWHSEWEAVQP